MKAVRTARKEVIPVLNLKQGLRHPTSPSQNGKAEPREPNFGVSMLSGGDASDIKTADFFSASRSNTDLKDMLNPNKVNMYSFTERVGRGNELRLTQKKNQLSSTEESLTVPVRKS